MFVLCMQACTVPGRTSAHERRYDECVDVEGLRESVEREYGGRMGSKREGGSDTIPTHTSRQWHHLVNMPDEHNKHECQHIPVMALA